VLKRWLSSGGKGGQQRIDARGAVQVCTGDAVTVVGAPADSAARLLTRSSGWWLRASAMKAIMLANAMAAWKVCKLIGLFDGYVRAVTAEAPSFQTRQRRYYFSSCLVADWCWVRSKFFSWIQGCSVASHQARQARKALGRRPGGSSKTSRTADPASGSRRCPCRASAGPVPGCAPLVLRDGVGVRFELVPAGQLREYRRDEKHENTGTASTNSSRANASLGAPSAAPRLGVTPRPV
jgi:hypothetical protein